MNFIRLLRNTERLSTVNSLRYPSILNSPHRKHPQILVISFTNNNYDYEQKRYYKNFGHKRQKETGFQKVFYTFLTIGGIACLLDYRW